MSKDDATWLKICYVLFALIVAFTGTRAMDTIGIQTGWAEKYNSWYPMASIGISLFLGAFAVWYLDHKKDRHDYFLASIGELRKVTWPSMIDTRRMTIVVCVVVGIFAVILAAFDLVWSRLLELLLT